MTLQEKYGIIPKRNDPRKLLDNIPKELQKDFIRGLLDADGSFTVYATTNNAVKYNLSFGGNKDILKYIENVLIENKLISKYKRKTYKRHEERDGYYFNIRICGKQNVFNALSWLYDDSIIYLDRKKEKYEKYKENYL